MPLDGGVTPSGGQAAIEYLSTTTQRWAAQAAQIELDARRLENCTDVEAISQISYYLVGGELEGPASSLLRSFRRISRDVQAAQKQKDSHTQHFALMNAKERLDRLSGELTGSSEPYEVRFRPITASWHQIVVDEIGRLADVVEPNQQIQNPYICGIPLSAGKDTTFVERTDISRRIKQLVLAPRRLALLLYGQRRTGKTSQLLNLSRVLPSSILLFFVDGQFISGASSYADFLYNMVKQMIKSAKRQYDLELPPLSYENLREQPSSTFKAWLGEIEQSLQEEQVALLALDEFGVLEDMPEQDATDFLHMLRDLIEHRPRFKVLLAGSHTLSEYQYAESYLPNTQVIKISHLNEKETRQLVEQPVKGFSLRYEPDASLRVYDLTSGYPYLVQLLCYEIVELKNEQPPAKRRLASLTDVEAAAQHALDSGSFFFADIDRNQIDKKGVALLRYLAAQGEGAIVKRDTLAKHFPDELDSTLNLILRRDLIEPVGDGYRFQVELIRRWFAKA